ncbi:MAG TPA: hypothetical protein PLH19_03230 [Anaerolineae bacterium]|nr:hypothetical protein [Anaerolineae bacterium]HQH37533.1 hypothetical protein [Anaerolineae bacterium]
MAAKTPSHKRDFNIWLRLAPLLLAVPAIQPFLGNELTAGYDNVLHLWRSLEADQMLGQGILYTRWFPDMVFGLGYPMLLFNPPLSALLAALFHRLGLDWPLAINGVFAVGTLFSGWTTWLWVRDLRRTAPPLEREIAALAAALVMVTLPFHAYVNYHRASMSEALAWAFPSLILWGLGRWQRHAERRGLWAAAGGLAAMLLTHDAFAYLLLPLLVAWVVAGALDERSWRAVWRGVWALGLGIGIAAFFWLPSILERGHVQFERVLSYRYSASFVALTTLLEPPRAFDTSLLNPWLPKGIGLLPALCMLPTLPVLISLRRKAGFGQLFILWITTLGYVWLAMPAAAWFWKLIPPLAFLHFPWRFLSPAAVGVAALAGSGCGWLARRWTPAGPLLLMVLSLGALGWLYPPHTDLSQPATLAGMLDYEHQTGWLGGTTFGELLPKTVQQLPSDNPLEADLRAGREPVRLRPEDLPAGATIHAADYGPNRARVIVESPVPFRARYWTFAYPGWRVRIDGATVPIIPSEPEGLITFDVPAGRHTLEIHFGETPGRLVADALSVLSLALLLLSHKRAPRGDATRPAEMLETFTATGFFALGLALLLVKTLWIDHFNTPLRLANLEDNHLRRVDVPLDVTFDGQFRLLGHDALPTTLAADAPLDVWTYWQDTVPGGTEYGVGMALQDAYGVAWNTATPWPPPWYREPPATYTWPADRYAAIAQRYELWSGTPPGVYTLTLSVFEPASAFTYIAQDATGQSLGTELTLGTVRITPPRRRTQDAATRFSVNSDAVWGPLRLIGYDVDREMAAPGALILLTFLWQADSAPPLDCSAQVQLVSESGAIATEFTLPPVRADFPTTRWQAGDVWRGRHLVRLPATLDSGRYRWTVSACPELKATAASSPLAFLDVEAPPRRWDVPPLDIITNVPLGTEATLLGVQGAPDAVHPGDTFSLTLVWRADAVMAESYRVFVHLSRPDGALVAQSDGEPAEWYRPTTGWVPGEIVLDPRVLELPVDLPPGVYRLQAGLYTLKEGRLRTADGADAIPLGEIIVQ